MTNKNKSVPFSESHSRGIHQILTLTAVTLLVMGHQRKGGGGGGGR